MKVTRDVITDLWLVYESGEASADTRALVEEFLRGDPEHARRLQQEVGRLLAPLSVSLPREREREALSLTQKLLRRRRLFLAAAIGCMGIASTLTRFPRQAGMLMWGYLNLLPLFVLAVAAALWVGYFRAARRLRVTGL